MAVTGAAVANMVARAALAATAAALVQAAIDDALPYTFECMDSLTRALFQKKRHRDRLTGMRLQDESVRLLVLGFQPRHCATSGGRLWLS